MDPSRQVRSSSQQANKRRNFVMENIQKFRKQNQDKQAQSASQQVQGEYRQKSINKQQQDNSKRYSQARDEYKAKALQSIAEDQQVQSQPHSFSDVKPPQKEFRQIQLDVKKLWIIQKPQTDLYWIDKETDSLINAFPSAITPRVSMSYPITTPQHLQSFAKEYTVGMPISEVIKKSAQRVRILEDGTEVPDRTWTETKTLILQRQSQSQSAAGHRYSVQPSHLSSNFEVNRRLFTTSTERQSYKIFEKPMGEPYVHWVQRYDQAASQRVSLSQPNSQRTSQRPSYTQPHGIQEQFSQSRVSSQSSRMANSRRWSQRVSIQPQQLQNPNLDEENQSMHVGNSQSSQQPAHQQELGNQIQTEMRQSIASQRSIGSQQPYVRYEVEQDQMEIDSPQNSTGSQSEYQTASQNSYNQAQEDQEMQSDQRLQPQNTPSQLSNAPSQQLGFNSQQKDVDIQSESFHTPSRLSDSKTSEGTDNEDEAFNAPSNNQTPLLESEHVSQIQSSSQVSQYSSDNKPVRKSARLSNIRAQISNEKDFQPSATSSSQTPIQESQQNSQVQDSSQNSPKSSSHQSIPQSPQLSQQSKNNAQEDYKTPSISQTPPQESQSPFPMEEHSITSAPFTPQSSSNQPIRRSARLANKRAEIAARSAQKSNPHTEIQDSSSSDSQKNPFSPSTISSNESEANPLKRPLTKSPYYWTKHDPPYSIYSEYFDNDSHEPPSKKPKLSRTEAQIVNVKQNQIEVQLNNLAESFITIKCRTVLAKGQEPVIYSPKNSGNTALREPNNQ